MNTKWIWVAVMGVAVMLAPAVVTAQVDSGASSGAGTYPPATPGMNQPGASQQNGQPGTAGITTTQPNQPGSMRDSLGAPGQTGQEMLDKQFMRSAAEGNVADIKMGSLAVEKGSPAVKELAQKLIDDHTTMNKDMGTVADSVGVMLPKKMNKDAQKEFETLSGLAGKDFDTEYVTYMAKVHFGDLHVFHMEASVAADPGLSAEVVKEMGMMHEHLGLIVNVAKEQGIVLPPRPQKPRPTTASK